MTKQSTKHLLSVAVENPVERAKMVAPVVVLILNVVEPLLMFCSVKMANIQKVAKNASLQRTPLSHPLKIC